MITSAQTEKVVNYLISPNFQLIVLIMIKENEIIWFQSYLTYYMNCIFVRNDPYILDV